MTIRQVALAAYREGLPALAGSAVGGLLAGVVLGGMRAEFRAVPGLLVLVPALLATRGNVYGSLGARLATGLHQGLVTPRVGDADDRLYRAVAAAISNGLLASVFAAVLALSLLIFSSAVGPMAMDFFSAVPIRFRDLVALFVMRTIILLPLIAGITHLVAGMGLL